MAPNTPSGAPAENSDILKPTESLASSPHTLMSAIDALKAFAGDGNLTFPGKAPEEAKRLLAMKDRLRTELPVIKSLIESHASTSVADINKFLASRWFNMKLREQGAGGVYVASTFKQEVEWTRPGKETSITLRDSEKEVPGVSMKSVQAYEHRLPDGTTVRVYMLKTKNGDIVSLMPYRGNVRKESLLGFSKDVVEPVATAARNERKRFDEARKEYNSRVDVDEATRDAVLNSRLKPVEELRFPMVDLDEKADLSWLQGARMGDVVIREAKAQFQLQMDEKGAVAKAAVGLGTLRGGGPRPDIIDGPMIVWFERDGVVTFSALVGTSDFKKPNRQK